MCAFLWFSFLLNVSNSSLLPSINFSCSFTNQAINPSTCCFKKIKNTIFVDGFSSVDYKDFTLEVNSILISF